MLTPLLVQWTPAFSCLLQSFTSWRKCHGCIFNDNIYLYTLLQWLQMLHLSGSDSSRKNTLNKKEWMLRWKDFNFAPQNALTETGTWSEMSLRSAAELWAWHLALYLTLELLGLPSLPLKLILVLVHATLFWEIQAALLQFKQWLKDSRSWMSSYWTTKRRQLEEEKNQSSTQSLSSLHSQSAHPVAKGKMQKWFSHSFEQILGNKVSLIPVPSKAGLP